MTNQRRVRGMVFAALLAAWLPAISAAQEPPAPGPRGERAGEGQRDLRKAMREYFEKRLRADLSLSDDQMNEILPRVERLEETRAAARRQKMDAVRNLRRGLQEGATDPELQADLDRLEGAEWDQRETVQSLMAEIDRVLSTRQRVQFRFFLERFRREMVERVREVRGDRDERGRGGPGRRRPPRADRP